MAGDSNSSAASKPEHLDVVERVFAGLLGVAILVWVAVLVFSPPEHKELISGCKATAAADCVQTVSSIPETVSSTLVGAGAILLLLAILGIRFTSIKAAGIELGAMATDSSKDKARKAVTNGEAVALASQHIGAAIASGAVDESTAVPTQLEAWGLVPVDVQAAVVRRWQTEGKGGHPSTNLAQVYAPLPDHSDWYIEFMDGTTYRVTAATS